MSWARPHVRGSAQGATLPPRSVDGDPLLVAAGAALTLYCADLGVFRRWKEDDQGLRQRVVEAMKDVLRDMVRRGYPADDGDPRREMRKRARNGAPYDDVPARHNNA